jgi:adenosylcobinamide-phosphate guanylyltransferase
MTALVMAGGRATRMNSTIEKPLLDVGGKPMMLRVIDALKKSECVDRIIVAVTSKTPQTNRMVKDLKLDLVLTPGKGYEEDMKYAIKACKLKDTLIISADLPFITTEILHRAVESYRSSGKPALTVMTSTETFERLASKPQYVFQINGRDLAPIGVNIVDGSRIDESRLEEEILLAESDMLALNVNSPQDLELARTRSKSEG